MILINLMPPELRPAAGFHLEQLPWRRIAFSGAGIALLITIGLPAGNLLRSRGLKRLQSQWERMQPDREKLASLQESLRGLKQRAEALQGVKAQQARWAPRLALLSDALIPQVWFRHLEYAQGKGLRLEGSALVGSAGDAGGQVSQFLQHLKEQPGFHPWFREVELESVEHRHVQNEEVADFILRLTLEG